MPKDERVKRQDLSNTLDIFKPLVALGTKDDPCFGKLHNPKNPICSKCGDFEFCAIMMGQNNHVKRVKAEAKTTYKDLEEVDQIPLKEATKLARKRLIELIKESPNKDQDFIINEVYTIYVVYGVKKARIQRMVNRFIELDKITLNKKNKLSWN